MSKSAGNRFGEIAVREGFASRSQVRECLEIQTKLKSFGVEPKRLGEIMVEKGYLRDEDVRAVLEVQRMGGSRMDSRSGAVSEARKLKTGSVMAQDLPAAPRIPGYEVLELLGEGGMGVVYKARQKSLDRMVALKILPARAARESSFIERFIREARTVARLSHENIIAGIDVGEADGTYYFAMEYVEGESVADQIARGGPLEERLALQIAAQIARALEHAHKHGLVHRDVKPQNILVTRGNLAKLCDLGLAKSRLHASGEATDPGGLPVGTPHYLSPEQARGEADVDIRSDIYSLGATLYHMLTGETPFEGPSPMVLMTKHLTEEPPSPRRRNPAVSRGAAEMVQRMMSKDKEDRHQTPVELLEDIERVLAGKPPASPSPRASGRRSSKRRSNARMRPEPAAPSAPSASSLPAARPQPRRSRARVLRSRDSNETISLLLIPLIVVLIAGGVAFIYFQGPRFPSGAQISEETQREADQLLKEYRLLQPTDPAGARAGYQDLVQRYPGTRAAQLASDYLSEMQ